MQNRPWAGKRIFWAGNPYFAESLRENGWEVTALPFQQPLVLGWEDVVRLAGGPPDVLVLGDNSCPPVFVGLEHFSCPTVFYCVDSHIHSWYPIYAQAFDFCMVSLRDHLPMFQGRRLGDDRVLWSPPFAKNEDRPIPAEKEWDVLFVGNVDPVTMPRRFAALRYLSGQIPGLVIRQGDYRSLYPRARVVLNFCEAGDLNFRVFESLGCGACLVTPAVGHGQADLFEEGRELFTYPMDEPERIVEVVQECLAVPARCAAVAEAGLRKVDAAHRATHRAESFTAWLGPWIADGRGQELLDDRLRQAEAIHDQYLRLIFLHWSEALKEDPAVAGRYLKASRSWRFGEA